MQVTRLCYLYFLGAVRRHPMTRRATDHSIKNVTAHWLTGARDRDGGKKERQSRQD
jgi:hypothetical protein